MDSTLGDEANSVLIDNGSFLCKAGFSGDDAPRAVFPAVVGHLREDVATSAIKVKDTYVGYDIRSKHCALKVQSPIRQGKVTNWDDMEKIWHHVFQKELRVASEEHPVFIAVPPLAPKADRQQITEIMFETFKTPAFYAAFNGVLSMYAAGRSTGIVFDSGDDVSHVVPVYECHALSSAIEQINIAGRDLTEYLTILLNERGYNLEKEIARDMKQNFCYAALNFEQELSKASHSSSVEKRYELPNGELFVVGNERFRCVETMFQPSHMGLDSSGVHEVLYKSVMKCDVDIRKELFSNVVLSGGSTMFPGLADRLKHELGGMVPRGTEVKVVAPPERKLLVWIGASVFTSLSSFKQKWITRQQYDENGPEIVHRKCSW